MKIHTACFRSLIAAGVCCLLLVSTPVWAIEIFLELEGVEGESQFPGYEGWIEAKSFKEEAQNTGSDSRTGKAQFSDVIVTKSIDKASTQIRLSVANGQILSTAKIDVTTNCQNQGPRIAYFKIELSNVLIRSVETTVSESQANILPDEAITLSFRRITWTYNSFDPNTCTITGTETATWDVDTNKGS